MLFREHIKVLHSSPSQIPKEVFNSNNKKFNLFRMEQQNSPKMFWIVEA